MVFRRHACRPGCRSGALNGQRIRAVSDVLFLIDWPSRSCALGRPRLPLIGTSLTTYTFPPLTQAHTVKMASVPAPAPAPADNSLLTLPVDVLKGITNSLDGSDEKSLKLTCRRMSLLLAPPPAAHVRGGNNPARDGRSTPLPQSPLPEKATITLRQLEQENHEVEQRDAQRGMELSDTEDGFEDDRSDIGSKPTKYKGSKILNWTAQLDSAPSSPRLRSPASFLHSPRPESPRPTEVEQPTKQ
ncbi:hypothetical protein F5883DRAFT_535242 [Diaporthe sp. PMI_573]|nr:hypothetical protein F5883DRAFT_535242 [Diaporthaceae sp. PMI_573]